MIPNDHLLGTHTDNDIVPDLLDASDSEDDECIEDLTGQADRKEELIPYIAYYTVMRAEVYAIDEWGAMTGDLNTVA